MGSSVSIETNPGFDYDSPSVPETAIADVAASMRSEGDLPPPLSDAERERRLLERELYLWECDRRREQHRMEHERQREEAEAVARYEAAVALAQANAKARLERQERIDKEVQRRTLADLQFQSARHQAWQNNVTSSFNQTIAHQQRRAIFAEMDAIVNPPAPPPELETPVADDRLGSPNYFDDNYNPNYYRDKLRGKFSG